MSFVNVTLSAAVATCPAGTGAENATTTRATATGNTTEAADLQRGFRVMLVSPLCGTYPDQCTLHEKPQPVSKKKTFRQTAPGTSSESSIPLRHRPDSRSVGCRWPAR